MADYPPTKGAKATRSVGATHLPLWGGVPSMGSGGVVVAGGVLPRAEGRTTRVSVASGGVCGSSQGQGAQMAQVACG